MWKVLKIDFDIRITFVRIAQILEKKEIFPDLMVQNAIEWVSNAQSTNYKDKMLIEMYTKPRQMKDLKKRKTDSETIKCAFELHISEKQYTPVDNERPKQTNKPAQSTEHTYVYKLHFGKHKNQR